MNLERGPSVGGTAMLQHQHGSRIALADLLAAPSKFISTWARTEETSTRKVFAGATRVSMEPGAPKCEFL